jgi:integrase
MVWLAIWREGGHRRAETLGRCAEMTKAQAMDQLALIVRRVAEQKRVVEFTLGNFITCVVFPWYRRTWKRSTSVTTEGRVRLYIVEELGDKWLSSFNRTILQDFLDEKATRGLSYSTVAHLRWDLRQVFRMAENDGLLPRNPAELLLIPKGKRPERRVLSVQQTNAIIAALNMRERIIVKLAGISGLRVGEILGLRWSDLTNEGIQITRRVYRGVVDTPKSHHGIRTAAIGNSIREDLGAWKKFCNHTSQDDWIFPSENNRTPISASWLWLRSIAPHIKPLGFDWVNFQVLRRTAVTLLNACGGADPSIVAAQCGHGVDVSMNVYNKVGIARQQDAINQLDQVLLT